MFCAIFALIFSTISIKTAASEVCNQLGTPSTIRGTDHRLADGSCVCHPHVIGRYCDACAPGHYALWTGTGCLPCAHCNREGTLMASNKLLLQCDTLGRCLCKKGYDGAWCDEKIPSLATTCEDCKPNCYKHKNKCEKCGECYSLVEKRLNDYLNERINGTADDDQQRRFEDLKSKVKNLLADIVDPPNVEVDGKIDKYNKELDLIKKELKELTKNKVYNELDKTLELFDKNLDQINRMKEDFRKELQNLAASTENAQLAKIVNEIISAKDEIVKHAKEIEEIADQTNQTCLETCKQYDEFDKSLEDNKKAIKELQQKLLYCKSAREKILSEFDDTCNKLNDLQIPHYENGQFDYQINDLDEKLKLYQRADELLDKIKDINLENVLNDKNVFVEIVGSFDEFINARENVLTDLTLNLKQLKQAEVHMSEVEKRLQSLKTIISNYLENNKEFVKSIAILLSLANTDDVLTSIEREIEFLMKEFKHILETAEKLHNRQNREKRKLDKKYEEFQRIIEKNEEQWREDKKLYLDIIAIYDFILKEVANEESLDAIEEEINNAYELLKVTYERRELDVELEYLKNTKAQLKELIINPTEICGSKIGDSEN